MPYQTQTNYSGEKLGSIVVGDITSSSPERKYACTCQTCKSQFPLTHSAISMRVSSGLLPECRNSACRKGVLNIAQNAKAWHIEEARREQEANKRAFDAAAAKALEDSKRLLEQTANELAILERERIKTGRDDFQVDDAVRNARMSQQEADRFNAESAAAFVDATPEYYPCDSNHALLCDYLTRNGCMIANEATWKKAFERLRDFGLLEPWPSAEPEPIPEPVAMQHEQYPDPRKAATVQGWDWYTGNPREYTTRELDMMTSEDLKKSLRIPNGASRQTAYAQRNK